jgi:hypothetical protein
VEAHFCQGPQTGMLLEHHKALRAGQMDLFLSVRHPGYFQPLCCRWDGGYRLISRTCDQQGILPGQFTIHMDRGTSMRPKNAALLQADLGVTKIHSRPYVSNDVLEKSVQDHELLTDFPEVPWRIAACFTARFFTGTIPNIAIKAWSY